MCSVSRLVAAEMSDSSGEVIVEIPQGKLRGKTEKSVFGTEFCSFHGIPYAKPPVGELRFKAPKPADGWTGIRDATKEGSVCPSADWQKVNVVTNGNEDSLFINVYCNQRPNGSGMKVPVMVWFHGGGFEFGSGNKTMCGPDYFMDHNIILVTFNYRLGVLGFLSLETAECPGNFGLKDQQLALKWVKSNISFFGGDPENITIFGISAGGASVHFQILALSNEGLFRRAIAQSGSAFNRWALARCPRENAFALGRRLGCDTKDDKVLLDFLKKASVEDLVLKSLGVVNETEGEALGEFFLNFTFVPSVETNHEGAFLSEHPWVLLEKGKYLDVPLITGVTSKEMIPGVRGLDDYPRFTKIEEFQQLFPRDLQLQKNGEKALAVAKRIKDFYFEKGIDLESYMEILSDTFFNFGVLKHAKSRTSNSNIKSPTFLYEFSFEGEQGLLKEILGLANIKGAAHGDDTVYLFKTDFSKLEKMSPGSRDYDFMKKFTKLWVNFATTGVPALEEPKLQWGPTSAEGLEYLDLDESLVMKKGLLKERMLFWDHLYTSYYN